MKDLNSVTMIGRITKDCEFGYLNSGSAKASFSIAVNDSKKNGNEWVDDTSFFPITVWGKTAENLHTSFTKGRQVAIEGKLKQDRYEKDGKKMSVIKIIVENIQLVGKNCGSSSGRDTGGNSAFKPKDNQMYNDNVVYENGDFSEEIPF